MYDHCCMALPETLNEYLEGYCQLINYCLFHLLIYLKFPGRFLMDSNVKRITSFSQIEDQPDEETGSYIKDIVIGKVNQLTEAQLFKLHDILTNDFMNSEPSGMEWNIIPLFCFFIHEINSFS
ncbi:hypothetical protein HMI54_012491 [Coelomomyces lativittatus]|nr:hypothetical protein HMI54_012491 [Coelomomyces lativittatus]